MTFLLLIFHLYTEPHSHSFENKESNNKKSYSNKKQYPKG